MTLMNNKQGSLFYGHARPQREKIAHDMKCIKENENKHFFTYSPTFPNVADLSYLY
jgi:hypothetical protein